MDRNKTKLKELEDKVAEADFWNLPEENRNEVIDELKETKQIVIPFCELHQKIEDTEVLFTLACEEDDEETLEEAHKEIKLCLRDIKALSVKATFTDEDDYRSAFIHVQAGAGGTDACDWAQMLLRMYTRYLDKKNYSYQILDEQVEEEGGIKNATIHVKGKLAYGYLKSESGVHRLVRISPFDSSNRRHTSFASLDIVPEFDDSHFSVEINEKDLKIDYYRASGAGGQHVNVTDSAVRIKHIPTGLTACCQNERSQHKNKAMAMKILQARIYKKNKAEQEAKLEKQYGSKTTVSWSNQIRSYVLHPYTKVKDLRTNFETGNTQAVLDGDIDQFIEAFLLDLNSQKLEKN